MTDDASIQMGELVARRAEAEARVEQLEVEQQAAARARIEARAALVEAERVGAGPADRTKLERALAEADAKPGILAARIEGARQAVRDAEVALARHVQGHLTELVDEHEANGRMVAEKINAAAEAIVQAFAERETIANQIAQLASRAGGRVRPGDVSRTGAEEVANAARRLLGQGGEVPPTLDRDPRQSRHGEAAPARSAA